MRTPFRIAPCVTAFILLGATASAYATLEPCEKNHYILTEPCSLSAIDVAIGTPGAVATDAQGNLYFSSPNLVFKIDRSGRLTRVAGSGEAGYSGDGGPATEALLNFPKSYPELENDPIDFSELVGPLALDAAGNLYIADAYNNRVRRVDANGVIVTVAGDAKPFDWGDRDPARLWWPQGIAVDAAGRLLVSDGTGILRRIAPDGSVTTLTENDCGKHRLPGLCAPEGIAVDVHGNVHVADGYCRIRKVSGVGEVVTIAGVDTRGGHGFGWTCGYSGDGGPATSAALAWPFGVAVDADGNLFIADTYNNCIRKVDGAGVITTAAGSCGWGRGYSGDGGPATQARLNLPHGIAVGADGNLFIADTENRRLRKVTPDGLIVTVAGNGEALAE